MRLLTSALTTAAFLASSLPAGAAAVDNGASVDQAEYANRTLLPDFTAPDCPDNPRALTQVKGNLYRHTTGPGLAVHSGLVLITKDVALGV